MTDFMDTEMDPDRIEKDLQEAKRRNSARALVESREEVTEARGALNEAEQEDVRRCGSARRSGWTAYELRQSGLPEPAAEPTQAAESTEHTWQPLAAGPRDFNSAGRIELRPIPTDRDLHGMAPRAGPLTLVVTNFDRLVRSLPDARNIIENLAKPQVTLGIGGSDRDTTAPTAGCSSTSWPWPPNSNPTSSGLAKACRPPLRTWNHQRHRQRSLCHTHQQESDPQTASKP